MRCVLALVVSCLLSGCTSLLVGGSGASGSSSGSVQRDSGRLASDSAITTAINKQFKADAATSAFNIGVRTYNGTVTLSGTVGDYVARDRAGRIAKKTGGVTAVNNQLLVRN